MAAPRRAAAALSLAVLTRGARKPSSGLAQLAVEGELPCKLTIKYDADGDEDKGKKFDAVTPVAECTEKVTGCKLLQPDYKEGKPALPIGLGDIAANRPTELRRLQLERFGGTYYGKVFTLECQTEGEGTGTASATAVYATAEEYLTAKAKADKEQLEERLAAAGDLPCNLEVRTEVTNGIALRAVCAEGAAELEGGVTLTPPKPYGPKNYGLPVGRVNLPGAYDPKKLQSDEFVLTAQTKDGQELRSSLKVPLTQDEAEVKTTATEPEVKTTTTTPDSGGSPCTLTKSDPEVPTEEPAFTLSVECSGAITEGKLLIGRKRGEALQETELAPGQKFSLNKEGTAGLVFWYEAKAGGKTVESNGITIEG